MQSIRANASDTTASAALRSCRGRLLPLILFGAGAAFAPAASFASDPQPGGGHATQAQGAAAGGTSSRGQHPARVLHRDPRDHQHRRADQRGLVQRVPEPVQDGFDGPRAAPDHPAVQLLRHRRPRTRPGRAQPRGGTDPRRRGTRGQQLRQGPDRRRRLHDDSGGDPVGPRRHARRRRAGRTARTLRRGRPHRRPRGVGLDQRSGRDPDAGRQPLHGPARGSRGLLEERRHRPDGRVLRRRRRPAARGAYTSTPQGKVIFAAFTDSYNKMVRALRNYKAQTVRGGLGTGGRLGVQGGSTDASREVSK